MKQKQTLTQTSDSAHFWIGGCTKESVGRNQKGFTLIELMIVVAIIGILASIAVKYFGSTRKNTQARSEVTAVFAEFQTKQEQALLETGRYLSSGPGNDEVNDAFPAHSTNGGKVTILPMQAEWSDLRINLSQSEVLCSYVAVTGDGGDATNVGPIASGEFEFGTTYPVPETDWYYILAHCDMDLDATVDSYYLTLSTKSEVFHVNQGK